VVGVWLFVGFAERRGKGRVEINHPVGGNKGMVERGHKDEGRRQAPHATTSNIRVCGHKHDDAGCVCQSKDGYVCAHVLNRMT
jgi:hypothetical protein